MSNEATKTFRCKRNLKVESSKPIKPEDISVNVGPNNQAKSTSSKPNSLALAILWAHFQACHQELLTEDSPAPWKNFSKEKWAIFLNQLINETNWKDWIQNPTGIKKGTLQAYNELLKNNSYQ